MDYLDNLDNLTAKACSFCKLWIGCDLSVTSKIDHRADDVLRSHSEWAIHGENWPISPKTGSGTRFAECGSACPLSVVHVFVFGSATGL
jgi:hypothetical protein